MAYRYEKNPDTHQSELVIDGFEKGIADSPYAGIGNLQNVNIKYYPGVAYVNYKRLAATISGGTLGGIPGFKTQSPDGIIYISDTNGQIWKQSAVNSSTFNLLGGNSNNAGGAGLQFWNNYLIAFNTTSIDICGDGTGDAGITSSNWNGGAWPIVFNNTNALTSTISQGDTSATFTAGWTGVSGSYYMNLGSASGQLVLANVINNDTGVTWFPAANGSYAANLVARPVISTGNPWHPSLTSINDGNLYFANSNNVGSFQQNSGYVFNKGDYNSFAFNSAALGLPTNAYVVSLVELRNLLIAASQLALYPWDRISSSWQNPVPLNEGMAGYGGLSRDALINILNNIYIFAGNKGDIYISNGYSVDRFKKLPDYVAGVVDPEWQFGGIMTHRQKLFFQAMAKNGQTGAIILSGIFSIDLDTGALSMDNQPSFGLVPGASSTSAGLLIDNNSLALRYDNYYSMTVATSSTSVIDYNNTTLYSSTEPLIETDLVPVGTFLAQKTFSNIEFKLDQPMQSGDSITVYARSSLTDSYTLVGTTTTAVLSDAFTPLTFQNFQWLQLKMILTCNATATASSFVRLREVRIR